MSSTLNVHNNNKLSIQLSSDGFSFCKYHPTNKIYTYFKHLSFATKATTPTALLANVKHVFEQEEVLHETYQEVTLIHHNNLNTWVPQACFSEEALPTYLQNTVKTFENDFVSFDAFPTLQCNNVYIPFVNINNFLFDAVGEFTYLHSATVFAENILKNYTILSKEMFVNVFANNYQLLVFENQQLVLANNFEYHSKEDFVYYILFVAEQLKMDANQFHLTFFGNIKERDENYKLVYKYVRNTAVYAKLNTNIANNITVLPQEHYNLLQLYT